MSEGQTGGAAGTNAGGASGNDGAQPGFSGAAEGGAEGTKNGQGQTGSNRGAASAAPGAEKAIKTAESAGSDRVTIEIDGVPETLTLDEARRWAQKAKAADKRFEEAAGIRKRFERLLQQGQIDPISMLKALGHDPDALAKNHIKSLIQRETLTPEEVEKIEMKKELEQYKKRDQEADLSKKAWMKEQMKNQFAAKIEKEATEVMEAEGLPKDETTIELMAKYLLRAKKLGYKDVGPKDVVEYVKADYKRMIRAFLSKTSDDKIAEWAGDDIYDRVRKHNVSKLHDPEKVAFKKEPDGNGTTRKSKKQTWEEYMKDVNARVES